MGERRRWVASVFRTGGCATRFGIVPRRQRQAPPLADDNWARAWSSHSSVAKVKGSASAPWVAKLRRTLATSRTSSLNAWGLPRASTALALQQSTVAALPLLTGKSASSKQRAPARITRVGGGRGSPAARSTSIARSLCDRAIRHPPLTSSALSGRRPSTREFGHSTSHRMSQAWQELAGPARGGGNDRRAPAGGGAPECLRSAPAEGRQGTTCHRSARRQVTHGLSSGQQRRYASHAGAIRIRQPAPARQLTMRDASARSIPLVSQGLRS
jgi:hypothetical protein